MAIVCVRRARERGRGLVRLLRMCNVRRFIIDFIKIGGISTLCVGMVLLVTILLGGCATKPKPYRCAKTSVRWTQMTLPMMDANGGITITVETVPETVCVCWQRNLPEHDNDQPCVERKH